PMSLGKKSADARLSRRPKGAPRIARQPPHHVVVQSFRFGKRLPSLVAKPPNQPYAVERNPCRSFPVLEEIIDIAAGKPMRPANHVPAMGGPPRESLASGNIDFAVAVHRDRWISNPESQPFIPGNKFAGSARQLDEPSNAASPQASVGVEKHSGPRCHR